jgi:diaminohydroxyphosphoribosylaminopyrimidine deaminase/5-amino-6-(5-phosphoribosylamino)uracil reductase
MSEWQTFDIEAMQRAFELAAKGRCTTQPNPRVGCVIAKDQRIVGEGWHQRAGEPHAEGFALREAGDRARGATAYVTLEPCNHHGRTPPCSEALVTAGVAKVIYASGDPNPRVDGSGAARLRAAGIDVASGLLAAQGEELNRGFFSRMRRGRPWLRLKLGASLDGRTALANGESQWITSPEARHDVQLWRAESAAILTTSATVLADDPRLDVRELEVERQPLRVLLDAERRVPAQAKIFSGPGHTVRFVREDAYRTPARSDEARHREVAIAGDASQGLSLPVVLAWLGAAEINELWTEVGPTLAGRLLTLGLVDEWVLYLAPKLLGSDARPLANLPGLGRLADARAWQIVDLRQIGPDIRIMLR